jgi:hypothetical protein
MRIPHIRFRRMLVAGVTALGIVGTGTQVAQASSVGPCADLHSFTFDFRTGGDDLRGNTEVIPFFITTTGDIELQHIWGSFANNSTNSKTVGLLNPNWTVSSCAGQGMKLRVVSHNDPFQSDDNWNMDGVTMYGYSGTGGYSYLLSVPNAFHRFTGSDQWWTRLG